MFYECNSAFIQSYFLNHIYEANHQNSIIVYLDTYSHTARAVNYYIKYDILDDIAFWQLK